MGGRERKRKGKLQGKRGRGKGTNGERGDADQSHPLQSPPHTLLQERRGMREARQRAQSTNANDDRSLPNDTGRDMEHEWRQDGSLQHTDPHWLGRDDGGEPMG